MVKRKEVDVDEDLIKSMMTGDIPRLANQTEINEMVNVQAIEEEPAVTDRPTEILPEKESSQPKSKRRKEPKDYGALFLKKNAGVVKRQTYVNSALYDKLSKILSIIAKDISVPNYIDNVLENHLHEYKDEINDMYRNNSDLIL